MESRPKTGGRPARVTTLSKRALAKDASVHARHSITCAALDSAYISSTSFSTSVGCSRYNCFKAFAPLSPSSYILGCLILPKPKEPRVPEHRKLIIQKF